MNPVSNSRVAHLAVVLVAGALGACGGSPSAAPEPNPRSDMAAETPAAPEMPAPPREARTDEVHGLAVQDPFRPLEDIDQASAWIDAQNAHTDAWLAGHADADAKTRLASLLRIGVLSAPTFAGPHRFFMRREGEQEQAALYVQTGDAAPRALVDPNVLDAEGREALDWFHPSEDGSLLAYGTSRDGDEISTLRVIEVESGALRPDTIPFTRAASIAWLPDNTGFFYTRFPGKEALGRAVFRHTLGADPKDDPQVMGEERLTERSDWPGVILSDDGKHLLVVRYESWSASTLHLLDLSGEIGPKGRWIDIAPEAEGMFTSAEVVDGAIWAVTNHGHPRSRLVRIDPRNPGIDAWQEIVPEAQWPLDGAALTKDGIIARYTEQASSVLRRFGRDGAARGEISLPVAGSVFSLAARHDDARILFDFQSFFLPPSIYEADTVAGGSPTLLMRVEAEVDTDAYTVERVEYPSYDGTKVPMFLVHKKGIERSGDHRVLLYGYGGFNVNLTPSFARNVLFWLERGGVYAVANLRGGGELGEAWHEAGMLEKKFQVFEDFEYAARFLIREGYTTPKRLAAMGGSNGGLLVGALLTRAPHLISAAIARVGLYDMVRYHEFPPAELWVEEYGSSEDAEQAGYLWAYSPYHQVLRGVRYPATLLTTADKDTRVSWKHTVKFAAALQEAQRGDAPILMRFQRAAGHGAGKKTSDIIDEYVELYEFLLGTLPPPDGAGTEASTTQ